MASTKVRLDNYEYLASFMELAKGNDFIENIPELTRDNITAVGNAIVSLQPAKDMFYTAFITKIKEMLFGGLSANNKFAFLKGPDITGIIEDSYVDYIKGSNFDPESETLLKNVKADITTIYHKIDRRLLYETSISDPQLIEAMLSPYGLDSLIGRIIDTMYQSNEWDEFTMFKEMIVHNVQYAGKVVYLGDYKDETGAIEWGKVTDAMLFNLRKVSKDLTYVSRNHNILGLASATPYDQQLVVMHKDMALNVDFASLSNIMNLDKVEMDARLVEVDNFNDNELIVATIMSKNAFRYRNALNTTETFRNGQTLTTKYMFHIWQMISYSFLYNTVYFVLGTEAETKPLLNLKTKASIKTAMGKK